MQMADHQHPVQEQSRLPVRDLLPQPHHQVEEDGHLILTVNYTAIAGVARVNLDTIIKMPDALIEMGMETMTTTNNVIMPVR